MSNPESGDTSKARANTLPEQRSDTVRLRPRAAGDDIAGRSVAQQVVSQSAFFSGPLPHPDLLAAYEDVHPGLAERIVTMAETEQAFGHEITRAALNAETLEHKRGQRYALAVSIAAFLCSFGLGAIGAHIAAAVVGGTTVVGLATAFTLGRRYAQKPQASDPSAEEKQKPGTSSKRRKSQRGLR